MNLCIIDTKANINQSESGHDQENRNNFNYFNRGNLKQEFLFQIIKELKF